MTNSIGLYDIDALVERPINEIRSWFKSKIQQIVIHEEPTALVVEPCITSTGSVTYRVISNLKADGVIATGLTEEMDPTEADYLFGDFMRLCAAQQNEVRVPVPEIQQRYRWFPVARKPDVTELKRVPLIEALYIPVEELLPEHVDAELIRTYDYYANKPRTYFVPKTPLVEEMLAEPPVYLGL